MSDASLQHGHPVRRFSWRALYVALPLLWAASSPLAGLLGPLGIVAPVLAVVAAFRIARKPPPSMVNPGCALMGLATLCWAALVVVVGFVGFTWLHVTRGSTWCPPVRAILPPVQCNGRDHSFLQGRESYAELRGAAEPERCRALLHDTPPWADGETFVHAACPPAWTDGPWTCLEKESRHGSGDLDRFIIGFDDGCTRARAWVSTNVTWEDMPARLSRGGR